MVPRLKTALTGPLLSLEKHLIHEMANIEHWFRIQWLEHAAPFYASVDLRNAGFEVLGMVAIFSYGFEVADQNFEKAGVQLICLSHYDALLPQAVSTNYIDQAALASLSEWRISPSTWKKD